MRGMASAVRSHCHGFHQRFTRMPIKNTTTSPLAALVIRWLKVVIAAVPLFLGCSVNTVHLVNKKIRARERAASARPTLDKTLQTPGHRPAQPGEPRAA